MLTGYRFFYGLLMAYRLTQHEAGSFPLEITTIGGCELSVLRIGDEYHWLASRDGRDVEGVARSAVDAKRDAENVALKIG
jgi:hypothetical protein